MLSVISAALKEKVPYDVQSSFAIILMVKRNLIVLLSLSSWCLMICVWLFFVVPWVCMLLVILVVTDLLTYSFFKS